MSSWTGHNFCINKNIALTVICEFTVSALWSKCWHMIKWKNVSKILFLRISKRNVIQSKLPM
jgi:hypothetical protein